MREQAVGGKRERADVRVIGVDLGERRVGVAVSDPDGIVATAYATIDLSAKSGKDYGGKIDGGKTGKFNEVLCRRLQEVASETKAEAVVVGMPLSLDGTSGPAAQTAEAQAVALSEVLDIPVFTHDERFTTAIAEQAMLEADLSRKRRKQAIDKSAATIMLQSWLDARSS